MGDEETKSILCPEALRKKSNNRDGQKGMEIGGLLWQLEQAGKEGIQMTDHRMSGQCPGISIVPKQLEVLKPRHTWGTRRPKSTQREQQ